MTLSRSLLVPSLAVALATSLAPAVVDAHGVARPSGRRVAPVRPAQPQDPAGAAIDRAARAFTKARTVRASFEQTLTNPMTGTEARATGELVLAQPNRVSVRFGGEKGDRVVADGQSLWVYLPSAAPGQVLKLPAGGKGVTGVDALGELLTSPRAKYAIADGGAATIGGRATRAVVLTPKAESTPLAKARVWVDDADASVRQIELTDANGLVRLLRMTTWTTNAPVPASTFKFEVPAGAKVVTRSAMTGG